MRTPQILFVCTGNLCRSPMAEYLLRQRLGAEGTWQISSAGLSALPGLPASEPAVAAMAERGIDLRPHRSRAADRQLIDAASLIVVMTASHSEQLKRLAPSSTEKTFLLKSFDAASRRQDIEDPIGLSCEAYRSVRDEAALPGLIEFLRSLEFD
jgi:protein-tyrosine-phosphatase